MILVTGGTGLVGAHLLLALCKQGKKPRALYRNYSKIESVQKLFESYSDDSKTLFQQIEWVPGDVTDLYQLQLAFEGIQKVFHCAAFISFDPKDLNLLQKTNEEGTANIVNLCLKTKAKLFHMSSVATLSNYNGRDPLDENAFRDPQQISHAYGLTKYEAEMHVWRGIQEGLEGCIVNPGVILGQGFWRAGSGALIRTVHKGLKYAPTGYTGFVSVEDVVACTLMLSNKNFFGERFILVAENLSYKDFIEKTAQWLGVNPPKKIATKTLLNLAWRLDWLRSKLMGKRRKLSKLMAKTLSEKTIYSHDKIKRVIGYQFEPIDKTLEKVSLAFLKDFSI